MCCSMRVAGIGLDVKYTAFSYGWGMDEDFDASPFERILIDGLQMAVTRKLVKGLLCIRAKHAVLRGGRRRLY